jgi:hypothetical protein
MKKFYLFFVLAVASNVVLGQVKVPKSNDALSNPVEEPSNTVSDGSDIVVNKPFFQRYDNMMVPDERYQGVKGSRYFYDNNYREGSITMTQKREFGKDMLFRFDQLEGTVQVKYPDGKEMLLDQKDILVFNLFIENKSVYFIRMKTPVNPDVFTLVQVIYYSPTLMVVRDPRKKLKRVENVGAYSGNEIYDTFVNDYRYFVKDGEENMQEVKPNAKSFAKAIPKKAKKIESLFKSAKSKGDLSVSKLAEIMKSLDGKAEVKVAQ